MLISAEKSLAASNEFFSKFSDLTCEEKVRPYTLPDPFTGFDGRKISTREEWETIRRPELLRFYQEKLYGFTPPRPEIFECSLIREKDNALDGLAVRREISVRCAMKDGRSMSFSVLLYLPKAEKKPVPVIITPNFYGNHTLTDEPDIPVSDHWLPFQWRGQRFQTLEMREKFRGSKELPEHDWKQGCTEALRRGYAVASFCYEAVMPDTGYHFEHSIYQLFHNELDYMSEKRDFGSIGAWSWGISRVMDCCEQMPEIDISKTILIGHSRLGKTVLWTGVQDQRVALTVSNNSGCCGAKLFHRNFGENLYLLAYYHPYWFSLGVFDYADREAELPVDQHELIGMIAPRLVYVASASEDHGADPKGEFLAAWHAGRIYELFGLKGLEGPAEFPAPETVMQTGSIAYHLRPGKHDITFYDWLRYLDYADQKIKHA